MMAHYGWLQNIIMKKLLYYFSLLALGSQQLLAQNTLGGKISDLKTNMPLAGASLYIPELHMAAISDSGGAYVIPNMPRGSYLLEVKLLGYLSQTKEVNIKESSSLDIQLKASGIDMGEVIVTGVSSATEQKTNPVPMSVVTQNDLMQRSSTNVIDALARVPGVSQITEGPAISKPVVRGLGYNRVVVMNDGVRQEEQQWGDEFGVGIDEYSVQKVEVLKGPASLAYGSDAMAGVINMMSVSTPPAGQVKGNILANYQTNNGLVGGSANIEGNLKGISWDVRYSKKTAHSYQNQYDKYVWNSAYNEQDLKGTLGINRSWGYSRLTLSSYDLRLGIIEGARDSATGKFTRHVLGSGHTDSMAIVPDHLYTQYAGTYPHIHQRVRNYKAVLDNSFGIGDGHLKLTLGWQQNYRQEANNIAIGDVYNNYFFLNTLNYNLQYVFPEKKNLEFSFGLNGMQQNSQDRGTVFLVPEYNLFDVGAFAIAKKTFNKLSISGGIRYQLRNLKGQDLYTDSNGVKTGNTPTALHRFTAYNSNFTGIAGSIGLTYDISKCVYAKLNLSRGFRAPNIAESGSNGIHDGTVFYEIGDPNLKPEVSTQVDATIGANTEDFTIEVDAFYNKIDHYIFPEKLQSRLGGDSLRFDPNSGLPAGKTFKYTSGNANLFGGEAVLNIHPKSLRWLRFDNSFSMVNAVQANQPDSSKYLPYIPPYKLLSQLVFKLNFKHKTFQNTYIRAGVDYYFRQDKVFHKFGNETVTPAYTLVNAGIGTDVCQGGHTLFSIYIYGTNLADVAYQSNMSRLKYTDTNHTTGRIGVYNMGRNISFKILVPLSFKK